ASAAGASAPGASAAGASTAGALLAARAGLPGDGDTTVHRPTSAAVLTGGGVPAPHRAAPRAISPLVRRLARDHGIDLTALTPSGPAGIVLRRDVERAVESSRRPAPRPEPVPAPEPRRNPAPAGPERIPLRGLRRAVADKLSRSRTEIPDATTWVDVDATGLLRAKRELGAARPGGGIGLLALLARVCVAGLARYPELNSTVDTERREIVRYDEVHLGFAAQTDRGLMVPVVRDAHRLTTVQLAAELARLTDLARSGNLLPAALTGGTFTLNNYGVFGVDGSTPIINHPEAALLGVGRIVDKPWVVDGELTVRKVTQLSLSFDHRVCDGGVAGGFLRYVADCVERPSTLLADL
ncbi:dihydrolipoamide acetyltransferase family protein, partial [Streptomyces scabiei]|uniref:dihydrolipoamide acetyltransferase family protein n=1 Tax=Streptomyces scabiei TaxID=1930 RepID=UPI0029BCDA4D